MICAPLPKSVKTAWAKQLTLIIKTNFLSYSLTTRYIPTRFTANCLTITSCAFPETVTLSSNTFGSESGSINIGNELQLWGQTSYFGEAV